MAPDSGIETAETVMMMMTTLSVHIYEWVFNNSSRLAAERASGPLSLFLHLNHACEGTQAPAERERIVRISNDFMQSAKGRRGNFAFAKRGKVSQINVT